MKTKAFTLIELLVVVAIIGILAAVGVVAYNGYTGATKKNATKNQHQVIKKYILTQTLKCQMAPDGVNSKMGNYVLWMSGVLASGKGVYEAAQYCNYRTPNNSSLARDVAHHFCYSKFKNFWDSSKRCGVNYENNVGPNLKPDLGQTLISCLDTSNPYECIVATQITDGEIIIDKINLNL
tara:strand:+ start:692 stop:1231 length:540 start_codon:yes stop_codon:yes gene_type:complete